LFTRWRVTIYAPLIPSGEHRHVVAQDFGDPVSVGTQVLAICKRGDARDNDGTAEYPNQPVKREIHKPHQGRTDLIDCEGRSSNSGKAYNRQLVFLSDPRLDQHAVSQY
jgi:hypothetical protein